MLYIDNEQPINDYTDVNILNASQNKYVIVKPCIWGIIANNHPNPGRGPSERAVSSNNSKLPWLNYFIS